MLEISVTETGKPDKVTYLSEDGHIVKDEWEHLLSNTDQTALKETPLKQQVFEFSLKHGESWSLDEEEEERGKFAEWLKESALFITGSIHKNGTRATIFNISGGIYSCELKEVQPPVKFQTWFGYMGKDKDFVIESMLVDTES